MEHDDAIYEEYQQVCAQVTKVLEARYPGDLASRAAVVATVMASLFYVAMKVSPPPGGDKFMDRTLNMVVDMYGTFAKYPGLCSIRVEAAEGNLH